MGRHKEAKECAEERYTLWAMNQLRIPGSIYAALALIQCCIHNKEFEDAEHYARHAMFMINDMADNFIPSDQRSMFLADGSFNLARAIFHLTQAGGIPPDEKQKAGEEAITLAREALELHTRLHGTESVAVARDMIVLADVLGYFNNVDDDEISRLYKRSISLFIRLEGSLSPNMAAGEGHLGSAYINRANRAKAVNDLDRSMANLQLALPHLHEAVRIYRENNHMESADNNLRTIAGVEKKIRQIENKRQIELAKADAAAAATRG